MKNLVPITTKLIGDAAVGELVVIYGEESCLGIVAGNPVGQPSQKFIPVIAFDAEYNGKKLNRLITLPYDDSVTSFGSDWVLTADIDWTQLKGDYAKPEGRIVISGSHAYFRVVAHGHAGPYAKFIRVDNPVEHTNHVQQEPLPAYIPGFKIFASQDDIDQGKPPLLQQ